MSSLVDLQDVQKKEHEPGKGEPEMKKGRPGTNVTSVGVALIGEDEVLLESGGVLDERRKDDRTQTYDWGVVVDRDGEVLISSDRKHLRRAQATKGYQFLKFRRDREERGCTSDSSPIERATTTAGR